MELFLILVFIGGLAIALEKRLDRLEANINSRISHIETKLFGEEY